MDPLGSGPPNVNFLPGKGASLLGSSSTPAASKLQDLKFTPVGLTSTPPLQFGSGSSGGIQLGSSAPSAGKPQGFNFSSSAATASAPAQPTLQFGTGSGGGLSLGRGQLGAAQGTGKGTENGIYMSLLVRYGLDHVLLVHFM